MGGEQQSADIMVYHIIAMQQGARNAGGMPRHGRDHSWAQGQRQAEWRFGKAASRQQLPKNYRRLAEDQQAKAEGFDNITQKERVMSAVESVERDAETAECTLTLTVENHVHE